MHTDRHLVLRNTLAAFFQLLVNDVHTGEVHEWVAVVRILGKHIAAALHINSDVINVHFAYVLQHEPQANALAFQQRELHLLSRCIEWRPAGNDGSISVDSGGLHTDNSNRAVLSDEFQVR